MEFNPYEVLGLKRDATPDQIREAFRKAASRSHPDHGGSADDMARVNEAYKILSDPARRRLYDEEGQTARRKPKRDEAVELAGAIFQAAVLQDDVSPVAYAVHEVTDIRDGLAKQRLDAIDMIKKLEKKSRKVRRKRGGDSLVMAAVRSRVDVLKSLITESERKLKIAAEACRIVKEHEEEEATPQHRVGSILRNKKIQEAANAIFR